VLPWPRIDPAKAIPWVEARASMMLAESQQAALRLALLSKVPVITGGPGVGKNNLILKVLGDRPADMTFCDPPC
jgi:exodeoxyribonuclease V alpha subunit